MIGHLLIYASAAVLGIGWIVYPLLMSLLAWLRPRPAQQAASGEVRVSVIVATREGVDAVVDRIANISALCHESSGLEIVVAVDHSSRTPLERFREALDGRAQVVSGDAPGGKAMTLNAGVRAASGEILLFADTAQQFLPGAIRHLVLALRDPAVGAATGDLSSSNNRRSMALRIFWAYESRLRAAETRVDSIVAVTGAIYALRKSLWKQLPEGLICDDLFVPMSVIRQGFRVVSCRDARAVDPRVFSPQEEFARKVRTLTGMLQLCVIESWILSPLRNRVWLQFLCHKLLRIVTPYAAVAGLLGGMLLLPGVPVMLGVAAFCLIILVVRIATPSHGRLNRGLVQLWWALLMLSSPLVASLRALRGDWNVWNPVTTGGESGAGVSGK